MCDFISKCVRPGGACAALDMTDYDMPPCFVDIASLAGNKDAVVEIPPVMAGSAPRSTKEDVLKRLSGNHIWLSSFQCSRPAPEFCEGLGRQIIEMLNISSNLLPKYMGEEEQPKHPMR